MGEALGTALLYGLLAFGVICLIGLIGIGLLAAGGIALAAGAAAAKVLFIVGGFFAGISLLLFCEAFDVDVFSWVGDLAYEIKTPALVKAADEGDVEKVALLLKKGKDPNKKSHGRTALGAACMHHSESSAEIVRMLLEAGANPNEKSKESQDNKYELHYGKKDSNGKYKSAPQFPLECAIDSFNYDAVRLLAKNGAVIDTLPNSDWQPVQYSLFYARSREPALILLEEGANPGYWYDEAQKITLMMKVCDDSGKVNPKILDALLALGSDVNAVDENAHSALFYCGEPSGFTLRPENVEWLVAHGADVNLEDNDGVTPIIYFSKSEYDWECVPAIDALLSHGAHVNHRAKNGDTALLCQSRVMAEEAGAFPVINQLLAAGANPNVMDSEGYSPLMYAILKTNSFADYALSAVNVLIAHGADVNLASKKSGYTAPMLVCTNLDRWYGNCTELVERFLKAGADVNKRSNHLSTMLTLAAERKNLDRVLATVKLLKAYGADVSLKDADGDTALDCFHKANAENLEKILADEENRKKYEQIESILTPPKKVSDLPAQKQELVVMAEKDKTSAFQNVTNVTNVTEKSEKTEFLSKSNAPAFEPSDDW